MNPRSGAAFFANATSLSQHGPGHIQGNDSPDTAPVVNYRGAILRAGLLGQVVLFSGAQACPRWDRAPNHCHFDHLEKGH